MKNHIFNLMQGTLGNLIGHRNLVRTGAFIMRAGRLDNPNTISDNGEILVQDTVLKNIKNTTATIIDCGANLGQWSTQLTSTVKNSDRGRQIQVFCFEPSSFTYSKLSKVLKSLESKNIHLTAVQEALSSKTGSVELSVVHDGAGTNSLVGIPGIYEASETVTVNTVDEFSRKVNLSHIDFLKIDAEGHDFDVILGAEKMLDEQQISVIQFEYNWRWIYGKHFLQEAFTFFTERDYYLGKVTPKGIQFYSSYDVQMESFVESNYIACTSVWKDHFATVPSWLD